MNNGTSPSLDDIRGLLERDGKHAVLLPIEARQKGPHWKGWTTVTYEHTLRQSYKDKLKEWANTGVLLGQPSDNLCPIDFDTNAAVEAFLQINDVYRTTLRTQGEQGEQLWAYVRATA